MHGAQDLEFRQTILFLRGFLAYTQLSSNPDVLELIPIEIGVTIGAARGHPEILAMKLIMVQDHFQNQRRQLLEILSLLEKIQWK